MDKIQNTISVKSSGNAGDIIYSLSCLQARVAYDDSKVIYYIHLDQPSTFTSQQHPLGDKMMTRGMFEMLKPLLLSVEWIEDVIAIEKDEAVPELDYNLDLFRTKANAKNLSAGDIKCWYHTAYPELRAQTSYPIQFNLMKTNSDRRYIILNRSTRYNNPTIDYTILQNLNCHIYFVGVENEYKIMNSYLRCEHLKVKDFKELAEYMLSAEYVIGNQSMVFSIAEQLKVPRILEQYFGCPNVIPQGGNWYAFQTQEQFEKIINLI